MSERNRGEQNRGEPDRLRDDAQLRLLTASGRRPDWVLDERTRRAGRRGIAAARAALRNARSPEPKHSEPVRKAS
jgi:hypothetical protein